MDIQNSAPLVVLIGGKATAGKSTFIQLVQEVIGSNIVKEFSTIDPCKELVRNMFEQEQNAIYKALGLNNPLSYLEQRHIAPMYKEIEEKTDLYRSLLHDLKVAWCKVDDGPNMITFSLVQSFFKKGGVIAFVNVREPEQIHHLIDILSKDKPEWRIITLNIIRDNTDNWSNLGDKETDNFDYDITINNNKTLDDLKNKAESFIGKYCF